MEQGQLIQSVDALTVADGLEKAYSFFCGADIAEQVHSLQFLWALDQTLDAVGQTDANFIRQLVHVIDLQDLDVFVCESIKDGFLEFFCHAWEERQLEVLETIYIEI